MSRKPIAQVHATVLELLAGRMPPDQAEPLADKLGTGTWTHDYPITAEEAKGLGLPVNTDMPPEIYQFMRLFPQPRRMHPSVMYIPIPHRGAKEGGGK